MFLVEDLGYTALFISTFLSATIVPFSSEVVLASMLLGGFNPTACLLLASVGNTLGGITNYFLGKLAKWDFLQKYMGFNEKKLQKNMLRIQQYGSFAAILTWLPFIGDPLAIALGFARCNFYKVLLWMFIGKFLRYTFIVVVMQINA
jgi:membrane protein YqaA with SNARE-associated domain